MSYIQIPQNGKPHFIRPNDIPSDMYSFKTLRRLGLRPKKDAEVVGYFWAMGPLGTYWNKLWRRSDCVEIKSRKKT